MGQRNRPELSPGLGGVPAWWFSAKPVLHPSPQPWPSWSGGVGQAQVPRRAALRFVVSASDGVSGRFAHDTFAQILTGLNAVELISVCQAIIHLSREKSMQINHM